MAVLIKVDVWEMLTDGFFTPEVLKTFDIHAAIACSSPSQISQCPTDRSITVVTYSLTCYKIEPGYHLEKVQRKLTYLLYSRVAVFCSAMVNKVSMENRK